MTARQVLTDGELGSSFRGKINDNFEELFDPDYIFAMSTSSQTIPASTWTPVLLPLQPSNTTGVTFPGSGQMVFPIGGSDDCSGIHMASFNVCWDNTLASLQMHLRKLRFRRVINGSTTEILSESDILFDPALGVSGEMARSFHQVYAQIENDSANSSCSLYADVWHNAKVGGSPVSIDIINVGIEAPLLMLARISNYT